MMRSRVLGIVFSGVVLFATQVRADNVDDYVRVGDVSLGQTFFPMEGVKEAETRPDNIVVHERSFTEQALPSGLPASTIQYTTFDGALQGVWFTAAGAERARMKQWVAEHFENGSSATTWEGTLVVVKFRVTAGNPHYPVSLLSFESIPVLKGKLAREKAAELALNAKWTGALSGVDARLDPRIAQALDSASSKYGWAASLKVAGALAVAGAGVSLYLTEGEGPTSYALGGAGLVSILVGVLLSQLAAGDIEEVTAPR